MSAHGDKPVKAVFTTGGGVVVQTSTAMLFETTWDKIENKHPTVRLEQIATALAEPTMICVSKTQPRSLVFVSSEIRSSSGRAELRVPVKVFQDAPGIVTSAHFGEPDAHGVIIWKRTDGSEGSNG